MFAFCETFITCYFFPGWQARVNPPWVITLGLVLVTVGQTVRSCAMVQAGSNFNHIVQSRKNDGHELVTAGLYSVFRHPSYFGFFWWGIGTQVVLGNVVSFVAYTGILWYFFKTRITRKSDYQSLLSHGMLTSVQTKRNILLNSLVKSTKHIRRVPKPGFHLSDDIHILISGSGVKEGNASQGQVCICGVIECLIPNFFAIFV